MTPASLPPQDERPVRERRRGFLTGDTLALGAIGLVVVLVSFPRLRDFVLRSNEGDARATMQLLAHEVFAAERPAADVADIGRMIEQNAGLAHRLQDAKSIEAGRRLQYHGYYFELARDDVGQAVLYAWPRDCGRTGVGAFVYSLASGLLGHPNGDARWSGADRPLAGIRPVLSANGWRALGR